jgi:hypothetical protein
MRKLLLAATALIALSGAANAVPLVTDLGLDPNISVARNSVSGTFEDQYTFTLDQAATITIVGITNTYAGGIGGGRFIANFIGTIFNDGLDGIAGTSDDIAVVGPTLATSPCGGITNCQSLAGSGILAAGSYYLDLTGTGESVLANYGGSITTIAEAVPEPATWGMMLLGFAGIGLVAMRKRRQGAPSLRLA